MSDGGAAPEPREGSPASLAALNTDEQRENLVWTDSPTPPAQLHRALGEFRVRLEHNAFNPREF